MTVVDAADDLELGALEKTGKILLVLIFGLLVHRFSYFIQFI
jgi:hypothetical protein